MESMSFRFMLQILELMEKLCGISAKLRFGSSKDKTQGTIKELMNSIESKQASTISSHLKRVTRTRT